jgi:hypothetical protein
MQPSFADLSDEPAAEHLPPLDQPVVEEAVLTPQQLAWRRDGVLILPRFLPDEVIDAYSEVRAALGSPGGWPSGTPYLGVPALRELCWVTKPSSVVQRGLHTPKVLKEQVIARL